jgi:hypothetical protein
MNLKTWIISKAFFDGSGGVGKSKLMEDFPHVIGPLAFYDTIPNLAKPWGRHPDTGDVLLVTEVDRYTSTVTTPGVMSQSDLITPAQNTVPAVCVTAAIVYDFATAQAIHAAATHLVLALETVDGSEPPISGWGPDDGFTTTLWNQIRSGLIALGMEDTVIDGWRTNNPDATRRDFYNALKNFITTQEQ